MDQVKTGELIKALRQQEGMTQRALAELLGVSDKAVSKWERSCGAPELTLLPRLHGTLLWYCTGDGLFKRECDHEAADGIYPC